LWRNQADEINKIWQESNYQP